MIRQALPEDGAQLIQTAKAHPVTGALLEVHWRIYLENPRLPYGFFLPGPGAALKISGQHAVLCGKAENGEELAEMLALCGVKRLVSGGWLPPGWEMEQALPILLRPAAQGYAGGGKTPPGLALEENPPLSQVLELLAAEGEAGLPLAKRDSFYADSCTRRNHGHLAVYGLRYGLRLVSTAGIYALTGTEGYISCVETLPAYRGRGCASALLGVICAQYGHLALSLVCRGELASFYAPFGFAPGGGCWVAGRPKAARE